MVPVSCGDLPCWEVLVDLRGANDLCCRKQAIFYDGGAAFLRGGAKTDRERCLSLRAILRARHFQWAGVFLRWPFRCQAGDSPHLRPFVGQHGAPRRAGGFSIVVSNRRSEHTLASSYLHTHYLPVYIQDRLDPPLDPALADRQGCFLFAGCRLYRISFPLLATKRPQLGCLRE